MNASLPQSAWQSLPENFSALEFPVMTQRRPLTGNTATVSVSSDAGVLHARVLLNCYAREVAMQEHQLAVRSVASTRSLPPALRHYTGQVLDIQIPRLQSRICVGVRHVSVTGNYDYITEIFLQDQQQVWRVAGWDDVAGIIIRDLSQREGTPFNQDLQQQITESVATMQHLLNAQADRQKNSQQGALSGYIASEQNLLTGHPFHPTPKSRSGWSRAEQQQYSPEHGASLQLRYFSVPADWIISDSLDGKDTAVHLQQLTAHGLQAEEGRVVLPLHPWQADWMLKPDTHR